MAEYRMWPVGFFQFLTFALVQFQAERSHGIVEVMHFARSDDRRSHAWLRQNPRERYLRIRHSPALRDG
jgi:hypothetical protein